MYYKRAFFIKARKYRRFGNVRIIICWHYKTDLNFGDSQNITCEANITPKTPNSLFQRFLRFFRRG